MKGKYADFIDEYFSRGINFVEPDRQT